jgi:hypothetical protein
MSDPLTLSRHIVWVEISPSLRWTVGDVLGWTEPSWLALVVCGFFQTLAVANVNHRDALTFRVHLIFRSGSPICILAILCDGTQHCRMFQERNEFVCQLHQVGDPHLFIQLRGVVGIQPIVKSSHCEHGLRVFIYAEFVDCHKRNFVVSWLTIWATKPRMQEVKELIFGFFKSLRRPVERLSPVLSDLYVFGTFLDVLDCGYHVFGLGLLEAIVAQLRRQEHG